MSDNKHEFSEVHIHPSAVVSTDAHVGAGTTIWHQVQVRERARIGRNCILGKGVYVDFDVSIGENCKLQNGVYVYHPAVLDDGVFLGPGVILTNDKNPRAVNPDMSLKTDSDWQAFPVWIERGASIGAGTIILPGIHIGQWAMIGAGSVVTRNVSDYGLILGNPAKLVGFVCRCGFRLNEKDSEIIICDMCGAKYKLHNSGGELGKQEVWLI